MENTKQNRERFYALYWGQKVIVDTAFNSITTVDDEALHCISGVECLLLKPLSSISDENAIEVARLWSDETFYKLTLKESLQILFNEALYRLPSKVADYLRSKRYAVPYLDATVEQQVQTGWIKLT